MCQKVPPTKWFQLGLQLNIGEHDLNVIRVNNPRDVDTCILEMFKTWLSTTPSASYTDLREALSRIAGGISI